MVSEVMAFEDESSGIRSNVQLKEQFCSGNEYALKVRKPYTITKQRERWTEEEHRKFLEALKLYGRAWRKIEDHVGTKTAVQIRSHAQKFFYKVSRDPSGANNTNLEDPIEIPPPRPKRKPMHPYPRKIVLVLAERSPRSLSPTLSLSDQENRSPKSVLSVIGSEMVGSTGSDSPDSSLSPVSCASGIHDESRSPSSPMAASVSVPITKFPVKLELFSQDNNSFAKEGSPEETSSRFLKLFGRTMMITDSNRSPPSPEASKPAPCDERDEKSPANDDMSAESPTEDANLPRAVQALYLMHFGNENSSLEGPGSPSSVPLWPFYGGLHFPVTQFNNPEPAKGYLEHKEKEPESVFRLKPSSRSAFSPLRIRTDKNRRGFVPYKKSTAEEAEEKRTHLCL